jgi:hypothetical protein
MGDIRWSQQNIRGDNDMKKGIILISTYFLIIIMIIPVKSIMAYITETSERYGILDIENKCDRSVPKNNANTSHISNTSCYSLGIKGGLIDGNQSRGQFGYSLVDGCDAQHSLDYCYGYILGYNKGYGHQTNNTEIWITANNLGEKAGYQHGARPPDQISCTVSSSIFCGGYMHGYNQGYTHGIDYWIGYADGEKQAYINIKKCHEQNNPKVPGQHTQDYKSGWLDGYSDEIDHATNVTDIMLCNIR